MALKLQRGLPLPPDNDRDTTNTLLGGFPAGLLVPIIHFGAESPKDAYTTGTNYHSLDRKIDVSKTIDIISPPP